MIQSRIAKAMAGAAEAREMWRRERDQRDRSHINQAVRKLEGNKFCFTGKMERRRADIRQELYDLGGQSCYSWEAGVTILVKRDEDWHSTKVDKAIKKGIPVITEEEYNELIRLVRKKEDS